jgi:acylphosphatase
MVTCLTAELVSQLKVRAHVLISGIVQGVFFRHYTRKQAGKHGVYGWVRNLHDGRVEAIFEGEKENVDKIIEFCRRGPPGSEVTSVQVDYGNWTGEFQEFFVRY